MILNKKSGIYTNPALRFYKDVLEVCECRSKLNKLGILSSLSTEA